MVLVSDIKLIRTDTTLDHSQKAEKVCPMTLIMCNNVRINIKQNGAPSGNRTRAARVAGEHSTTEPTMLAHQSSVLPPPN